jgi:hypothetical protein
LRDVNLFARFFKDPSWDRWKIFLMALFAEAMPDEAGLAVYRQHTGRTTWPRLGAAFREAALVVGRRGGKSRIMGLIAVFLACFRDYSAYLAPGQKIRIAVLAKDRDQAREIFNYVIGLLEETPLLAPMIVRRDTETIELNNRVVIAINTASFRSTRGFTFGAVLADEVAYWHSEEYSANPDTEILRALRPGLASIPGAPLIGASSPYAKKGELWGGYRRHYGKDDSRVLVWKASTAEMNSSLDPAVIEEAYAADPEAAKADYGAEFRSDLADFVTVEAIEAVTAWGRHELPPMAGVTYIAFLDPSGGSGDAMTLAIGHLGRNGVCVLDAVLVVPAPFDPDDAVRQCAALCRRYGVSVATSDYYAGEWVPARFREHGIEVKQSDRFKSAIYVDFLPLVNARRVELLDILRIRHEAVNLERRTSPNGKDTIDHTRGAHDDLINAVAGCLTLIDLDRRPVLIKLDEVVGGVELPDPLTFKVVITVIMDSGPDIATVTCGFREDEPLYVLDAETVFFRPGLFDELIERLRETAREHHCGIASLYAPQHLIAQIGRGVELPEDFDPDLLLTRAAGHTGGGNVKFCSAVRAKMATNPIGAALTLKAGDEVETALRAAFIAAIQLRYGDLSLH